MSRIEKVKAFFNKDNFDYSQGDVDPYEFHKTFYHLARLFRLLDNEPTPKWTIIIPIVIIFFATVAFVMCFLSLVNYIISFDILLITEIGIYFILVAYQLMIIMCTIFDKPHYHQLLQAMRDDFHYICTKGSKYRVKFFQNHLWTWKACVVSATFVVLMGGGMVVCANLALLAFLIYNPEGGVKPLPFPLLCFGIDFGKSPTYEIVFVFSNICVVCHVCNYTAMMQTQIVWIRQIMSKADVIIWSIEDLLVDVHPTNDERQKDYYCSIIKTRMAEIIKMHSSMYRLLDDYAEVYRKLLMIEQKLCAPVMCLASFCSVQKFEDGEFPGIVALLGTTVVAVVFIPNYMCTALSEKVQSIRDACWNTPFWNAPRTVLVPYYVLIMQRSLRPIKSLQPPGFQEVSLHTFSDKMNLAYTGFNMLRQSQ